MNNNLFRHTTRRAIAAYYFATGIIFACWASRIPDVKAALSLSDGQLGTVLFAIPAGQLFMMAISAYLVSHFGSRRCGVFALSAYAAILVVISLSSGTATLFASLFLFGMMANLNNISLNTQASVLENQYGRAIMSTFHGLWSLGGLTGGILGAALASAHVTVFQHAVITFVLALGIMLWGRGYLLTQDNAPGATQEKVHFSSIDRTIVMLGAIAFAGMFCEGIVYDWSAVYFASVVMPEEQFIRMGYIAGMGAMTVMRFLADGLVTKFSAKGVLRACGILITSGLLIAVALPYLIPATFGFLLVGMGISSSVPICYSIAGRHPHLPASLAITIVSSISFFGFMIGPPLIGVLAEVSNLRVALGVVCSFGLVITVLAGLIKDAKK